LTDEEENHKENKLIEVIYVGTGIWEGILHTSELHVLKCKEAMIGAN
jgi:hypothetical protein